MISVDRMIQIEAAAQKIDSWAVSREEAHVRDTLVQGVFELIEEISRLQKDLRTAKSMTCSCVTGGFTHSAHKRKTQ